MVVETQKQAAEDEEFFASGGQAEEPGEGTGAADADAGTQDAPDAGEGAGEAGDEAAKAAKAKAGDGKTKPAEEKPIVHNKAALDAERNLRKKVERERAKEQREAAERFARLEERLSILQEAGKPKQEGEDDLGPDPEADPVGALKWQREQRARDNEARRQWEAQWTEHGKKEQANRAEYDAFERDFAEASREWSEALVGRPEYGQIRNALLNSLAAEIQFQEGLFGEPLFQRVRDVEKWHAVNARRKGIPIDDYIVRFAASRNIGLPQQQANGQGGQQSASGEGIDPAQANNGAAAEIARLAKAQGAADTLSGAGGSPGGGKMTLEALDRMTPAEFKAYAAKINKADPNALDKMVEKLTFGR